MKIGLIGNMNNNFFALLRYLLQKGYDAELVLLKSEFFHFFPENDTFSSTLFPIIKSNFSIFPSDFWNLSKSYIKDVILKYDFSIGCGPAPAIFNRVGESLDIFAPYGSDIYETPNIPLNLEKKLKRNIKQQFLSYHQRQGVNRANNILMDYTNEEYELMIKKINIKNRLFINIPFLYIEEYNSVSIKKYYSKSIFFKEFQIIRNNNDFVIFHHSRHEWDESYSSILNTSQITKGNHKLITGFANFCKNYPDVKAHLILLEYGSCVSNSKRLINELGISKYVTWFPLMPRKEIMVGISLCDVGVGELDQSYFSYGAVYEFLAMGKPVIHYRDDSLYKQYHQELYPMFSANSSQKVEKLLQDFVINPDLFRETGQKGYIWFRKNAINKPLDKIISLIQ